MMSIEEILALLSGTEPTPENPTPGFSPIMRRKGQKWLEDFEPRTVAQKHLRETALALFGDFTPDQHRQFREALFDVYFNAGYTLEELRDFFKDILPQ